MDISLNLDYETGRQIEVEGGMELPDFDDWLEDMVGGGQGQHPEEVQDDHQQVEEGAEGGLEQGGHERVQGVQVGGADGHLRMLERETVKKRMVKEK